MKLTQIDKVVILIFTFALIIGTIGDYYIYKGNYTLAGCLLRNIYEVAIFMAGYIVGRMGGKK